MTQAFFQRQINLEEIGNEGQNKLASTRILIVGMGGLGCPIAQYLVRAGITHLGIMDSDTINKTNLNRQILYSYDMIGCYKVDQAKKILQAINPELNITRYMSRLSAKNARIMNEYDIIVDACDNYETRLLMDDYCKQHSKIFVHGGLQAFNGQIAIFDYKQDCSFSQLFPTPPIHSNKAPDVIGTTAGIIALFQANEVIKIICNFGNTLLNKMLIINTKEMNFNIISLM